MPALAVEEVVAPEWEEEDASLHVLVDIVSLAVGVPGMSALLCFIPQGKHVFK